MNKQKIEILFIHHTKAIGGAAISMIKTIEHLDKCKYMPTVLLIKDSEVRMLLDEKGIRYIVAPQKFYRKYYHFFPHYVGSSNSCNLILLFIQGISWLLSRYYYSKRLLENINCDVIHLNSSVLTDFLYAANKKGKTIIHIREAFANGYFGFRKAIFRRIIHKYSDHIIAISQDNAARIDLLDKTSVVFNFVEIPDQTKIVDNDIKLQNILYVGGASAIKGFYTLVESLDFIEENIRIIFAGQYPKVNAKKGIIKYFPQNRKLSRALNKMRTCKKVSEVGFKNNIYELILQTEFLIAPLDVEHFSRPIIEAFAHQRTAIGSDVEGMDEIIDHNINGLIVRKKDPKALAEAINYLCANPNLKKTFGKNGLQKAKKLYSPMNIKQIEEIYESLLKSDM